MRSAADVPLAPVLRVHVEAPGHTVDLVVPPTVTAAELAPAVVDAIGGWDRLPDVPAGWVIRTDQGRTLPADARVGDVGLVHGDTLRLVAWTPEDLEPRVDDVVAEVADAAAALPVPWAPRVVAGVAGVVVSWLGVAWLLADHLGRPGLGLGTVPRTTTAGLVATAWGVGVALVAARWWRHHRGDGPVPAVPTLSVLPWWGLGAGLAAPGGTAVLVLVAALGVLAGAGALLAVSRGADLVALAAAVAAAVAAVAAGTARLAHASDARTAALAVLLGLLVTGLVPWLAGSGLAAAVGEDRVRDRPDAVDLAARSVGRHAAARAGALGVTVLAWPWLATAGGIAAPVLGVVTAAAVLVATRRPSAGADRSVSAVVAALASAGIVLPAAALAGGLGGVGAGLTVLAAAVLVARLLAAVPAPVRAGVLTRVGVLEVLCAAAVPALVVTVWGGYAALAAAVRGILA